MNKKIAIIPGITIIAIIAAVSQVNLEDTPEETVEVETVSIPVNSGCITASPYHQMSYALVAKNLKVQITFLD